jgi:hypothetical protein
MGLDIHTLNLLRFGEKSGLDLSSILTIGRPTLFLTDDELAGFLRETGRPATPADLAGIRGEGFSERFLRTAFGAREVESLDASPYENATIIHDMNRPMVAPRQFSTVLDFGCLEHIFNLPVALANVIASCRDGGHVLHVLPTNNWCGHGFYQFSPELFFSLYSEARGFRGTQVFLAEWNRPSRWYRVRSPMESGKRVNVINQDKTYVLVLTTKTADATSPVDDPPQQSDYVQTWSAPSQAARKAGPSALRTRWRKITRSTGLSSVAKSLRQPLRSLRYRLFGHKQRLHAERRDLETIDVGRLIKSR